MSTETISVPVTLSPVSRIADEAALESALRATISALEQLTELVSVADRFSPNLPLLVDELMNHAVGMSQAAGLVDWDTGYRVTYSAKGRERLAQAIGWTNNENEKT